MMGLDRAKRTLEERVTRPVSSAMIISIFALLLASIALIMGMSR